MKITTYFILLLCIVSCKDDQGPVSAIDQYNPVWDTPSEFSSGSMPLGNGDVGVNAWVEKSGDLLFYIGKTDTWSENGRLLKVGKVRVSFSPSLVAPNIPYRQELHFHKGEWIVAMGEGKDRRKISMWVDANNPVIHVDVEGDNDYEATVSIEPWRTERRKAREDELHSFWIHTPDTYSPKDIYIEADSIINSDKDQISWFHHNKRSVYKETMLLQGLDPIFQIDEDPLMHRTFGGLIRGNDFVKVDSKTLRSNKKRERQYFSVYLLTTEQEPVEVWKEKIERKAAEIESMDIESRKDGHYAWWDSFWNRSWIHVSGVDSTETRNISTGWFANRYLYACGGRGQFPIKFNGSIFNVDGKSGIRSGSSGHQIENWDADFREWGDPYWFQNQRQIYWPMLAAGDYDMMMPFFKMYSNALPLAKKRTELYYGHKGAFFPETMLFYGPYGNSDYGWDRSGKMDGEVQSGYIKRYWQGGLELSTMMLEYYKHTKDQKFLEELALPIISEVIVFFSTHWPLDPDGKISYYPAQALETYWDVKNPLPEIAGMKKVLAELLALPKGIVTEGQLLDWQKIVSQIPDFPIKIDEDGKKYMAPAWENHSLSRNVENIGLYSVFPYRHFGVGREDIDIMYNTFAEKEFHTIFSCWHNDPIYAAFLGLTDMAREQLGDRFVRSGEYRFPAFYIDGDWVPDHDNGGVAQQTVQAMLLQSVNNKMYLFPAWPVEWDVDFKVHAPENTIVEAKLKAGKITYLNVTPEEREKDLVVPPQFQ